MKAEKPRYSCWVLNYRCPLRCKMCFIWNVHEADKKETTLEEKKRFIRSLKGNVDAGFEFHLSGGEPLASREVFDLIDFIRRQGYRTNMVTNGFFIDEAVAKRIVDSGLDTITFSLDGIKPETHDFLRGITGSHRHIRNAIDYIDGFRVGGKPVISILTILMGYNFGEIIPLVEWVQNDARIEMISFQAVTQPLCEEADPFWFQKEKNHFLWPQNTEGVTRLMTTLRQLRLDGYKIGNQPNHFLHFKEYFQDPNMFLKKIKCTLGDYEFHVDPYGKIFFCNLMHPIGNIKADDIHTAWYSSQAEKVRNDVYSCRRNCHIMINCFYEDETVASEIGANKQEATHGESAQGFTEKD